MPLPPHRATRVSIALASIFISMVSARDAAPQSGLVDEGTFMVSRNGAPIGRESFRIVRAPAPGGQVFQARSQSALGGNRITTILGTDSAGAPVSYEAEVARDGRVVERVRGSGNSRRFSVLVQTSTGEASREYSISNGALLIDEDVIHQLHFVGLAMTPSYDVIAPRATGQAKLKLEPRGTDTIEIAGARLQSRRFALVAGGGSAREIWLDSQGRVLKVALPDKSIVAVRDELPR